MKTTPFTALFLASAFAACGPVPPPNQLDAGDGGWQGPQPIGYAKSATEGATLLGPVYGIGDGWALFLEEYEGESYFVKREYRMGRVFPAVPIYYEQADCSGTPHLAVPFTPPIPGAGTVVSGEHSNRGVDYAYIVPRDADFTIRSGSLPPMLSVRKPLPSSQLFDECKSFDVAARPTPFSDESGPWGFPEVRRVEIVIKGPFFVSPEP
jgi:hypothetical protein